MEVPIFYPTYDEFKNFSSFIASIEARGAHRVGLAKIVPPKEWKARRLGYKQKLVEEKLVENPIKQEVHGKDGAYSVFNIQQRSVKLNYFQRMASSNRYAPPSALGNDCEKLEKKYWQSLTSVAPIYGADVSGSLYDEEQNIWNVNNLGTILDDLATEYGAKIQGVNTAYLYYGMWKASFAWHTEDMDLYSINYLHFGAPKQWYVIPPSSGRKFEQLAAERFPALARRCPAFLRHKMTIISPAVLTENGIPYSKMTQNEGEFIITFPFGYHSGFNYGFNCAESTNFALERWIEYGKHSIKCTCRQDMVKISMDQFVQKYQPELYDDWCRGLNLTPHPEDRLKQSVLRTSPTKQRSITQPQTNLNNLDLSTNVLHLQQNHHERVANDRYGCIFRNLAKFDKQKQVSIACCPTPLVRAALSRAKFKMEKNPTKNSNKLLCLTARLLANLPTPPLLDSFYGLKQSGKYREHLLNGLWNYQSLDLKSVQAFNHWFSSHLSPCAICSLLVRSQSSALLYQLLGAEKPERQASVAEELLQCSMCHVSVHRQCYEDVCLAMNVPIDEEYSPWLCQRCILKEQQTLSATLDDRCSACLLRGSLLMCPHSSSSFIHATCSIYQAYQTSFKTLSCHYCWSFCLLDYRRVSTHNLASCNYDKCNHAFHVTCGLINGCAFTIESDSTTIHARCHLHASTNVSSPPSSISQSRSSTFDEMEEEKTTVDDADDIVEENQRVPNGTRVLLENKIGQVIRNEISYHYSVDFGDDTFSHDMLAEDILDSNPSNLILGSNTRIKWTDGTIYSCKYLGRKRVLLYHIKVGHEIRQMQRHEFSLDIPPPSPPPTPCEMESDLPPSRSLAPKRANQQAQNKPKRRRRLLLSSSSSSSSSEES